MRKHPFIVGHYYHIYNRGTDKRVIFTDKQDLDRFFRSMKEFNTIDPIGSIWKINRLKKQLSAPSAQLVDVICYCLNPNHYHFILSPLVDGGIEKFMQKLGAGYTMYFNEKYNRTGVLFQGKFKSILINSDKYLMYLSAYVNLNNRVHKLSARSAQLLKGEDDKMFWKSSWEEFLGENQEKFCSKSIILGRYEKIDDYKEFAESVARGVLDKRSKDEQDFDGDLFIEELN